MISHPKHCYHQYKHSGFGHSIPVMPVLVGLFWWLVLRNPELRHIWIHIWYFQSINLCRVYYQVFCLRNSMMTLKVITPTTPATLPHRTSSSWRAPGPGLFQYGKYRIIFMYCKCEMDVYWQMPRIIHRSLLRTVSLLSCPRSRQLYRIGSLHPPGNSLVAGVHMDAMTETSCIVF